MCGDVCAIKIVNQYLIKEDDVLKPNPLQKKFDCD